MGCVASTDRPTPAMTNTDTALDRLLARSPRMAVRPEPFGALAYHYDSRALMFLHHPDLVNVLTHLDGTTPLEEALTKANIAHPRLSLIHI